MKISKNIILLLLVPLVLLNCKKEEVIVSQCTSATEKRDSRVIAYDILDVTEKGDFGANYAIASGELKSEFVQLLQPWNAFENNQPDVYDGEAMAIFET